ncbi:hypothetical protein [Xanthomonas hortorum]|uniref:hypothetical protein n=1 Tax=Xanthomonas hortorum TaxID=56454 RepID=UPI0029353AE3|nr:hypothetical protein [Xanthomonas hortorum]MDV2451609.1 hypothetical protein [Xanthomonas hortorum NBC5720]
MQHPDPLNPALLDLMSQSRLNSYANVFAPSNNSELLGAYLWNTRVCSALYPLVASTEVSLRNAVDLALSQSSLQRFWWSGSKLQWKSRGHSHIEPHAVMMIRENFSKASRQVIRDKRERYQIKGHINPTHHEIIAKTEFSTWEFILDNEFMGRQLIWPGHLSKVFTGDWGNRKPSVLLNHARELVKIVRAFRNRLSHHEPAWKRAGVVTENDAISHLHSKLGQVMELMALINPEQASLMRLTGLIGDAERACSALELRRFQLGTKDQIVRSGRNFAAAVKFSLDKNALVSIRRGRKGKAMVLYPFN